MGIVYAPSVLESRIPSTDDREATIMPSPTEDLNRLNRAIPIVFALIAAGIRSHEASKSNENDWSLAAQLADMKDYTPSVPTQKVVIGLLVQFEAMQSRFQQAVAPAKIDPIGEYLDWAVKATEPK